MQNEAAITAGQSIRAVRELAGLTQAEAAQLTGRSVAYLSLVENGKAPSVTPKYIANTIGALSKYIANPVATKRTVKEKAA
jgi:transcriptional regulator with XRE-family HTH domain